MSMDEVVVEDKRRLTSCNTSFALWERFNLGGTGIPVSQLRAPARYALEEYS